MLEPAARAALEIAVGVDRLTTDPDRVASHTVDWTGRWQGDASAVVRPANVAGVRDLVVAAREHHLALVPQGGNTSLVGGATPSSGAVVVDLRSLEGVEPVDVVAGQVTTGAGVTLAALQAHVATTGLGFGVDLGSRDSATIGGMVATDAGGLHVVRHGTMRAQVLGIEAVLGTGEVLEQNLRGLHKDNTGYDLAGLLCGSEGTLGIVTRVRLRLVPIPARRLVLLVGFPALASAVEALPALRACPSLRAVEVMLAEGVDLVAGHLDAPFPLAPVPPCTLLVELAGDDPTGDAAPLVEAMGSAVTVVAEDRSAVERLWRWREGHPEAAAAMGVVHKADVSLPVPSLVPFVEAVGPAIEAVAPGAHTVVYGHLADGNLHVNVVGPPADDDRPIDAVLELVLDLGGSVSAEHGIGIAKRHWLERQRGIAAVAAMRAVKRALDPDGVLNPGVLLPDP